MRRFGMDTAAAPLRSGEWTLPNWFTGKGMAFFFIALFVSWIAFGYVPAFDLVLISGLSVVLFFYGGMSTLRSLNHTKEKNFVRKLFVIAFIIRLIWVLYLYYIFNPAHYSNTMGDTGDVEWYIPFGKNLTEWLSGNSKYTLSQIIDLNRSAIDDVGYPMWLGFVYLIVGVDNDVFFPFMLKCIMGAYCAICVYHIAKRHFGEGTARMAAIFICVNLNMKYW